MKVGVTSRQSGRGLSQQLTLSRPSWLSAKKSSPATRGFWEEIWFRALKG